MTKAVFTADGRLNTKNRRQADIKKLSKNSFYNDDGLNSYKTNTKKEELCFEYVKSFSSQFSNIYPNRKPLLLMAENEYGVKKFLPTAIRPTEVPFVELYDLYETVSYFAGYLQYEPLDPPNETPKVIFSPTQTLTCHIGDSFDISVLLSCFLLGAGYDAYVVNGYAPRHITLKDQSMTLCPMVTGPKETPKVMLIISEESSPETTIDSQPMESNYTVVDNAVGDSQYLKNENEARLLSLHDTFRLWIQDNLSDLAGNEPSENDKSLVHSWVMVLPTRRDIKEVLFIEPSTGRVYNLSNYPYFGIESAWNNVNYWINMKPEANLYEVNDE